MERNCFLNPCTALNYLVTLLQQLQLLWRLLRDLSSVLAEALQVGR